MGTRSTYNGIQWFTYYQLTFRYNPEEALNEKGNSREKMSNKNNKERGIINEGNTNNIIYCIYIQGAQKVSAVSVLTVF